MVFTLILALIFVSNFYIYAKDGKFVISTLDKKYEGLSYNSENIKR